jgi:hypothetical protein
MADHLHRITHPFDRIILLWAKQTNAPKKGKQDMETKCGRFVEWLGHDDMARVGFENCRDYRDAMIDEGDLSSGSILNHVKLLKALHRSRHPVYEKSSRRSFQCVMPGRTASRMRGPPNFAGRRERAAAREFF